MSELHLSGIAIPEITTGDHIADIISERAQLQDGDVVVITSQIVSIAEGSVVSIPSENIVSLVEEQSARVLRTRENVRITETPHGFVCANAGIDWRDGNAVLLPRDADRSAFKLRERLRAITGVDVAVIISATFVRAWRNGSVGVALGCSGINPIVDGVCVIDQIAGAAELIMRTTPVVVMRGLAAAFFETGSGDVGSDVITKQADSLFR